MINPPGIPLTAPQSFDNLHGSGAGNVDPGQSSTPQTSTLGGGAMAVDAAADGAYHAPSAVGDTAPPSRKKRGAGVADLGDAPPSPMPLGLEPNSLAQGSSGPAFTMQ